MNANVKVIGLTRLGIEPQVYPSRSRRSIPLGHLIDYSDIVKTFFIFMDRRAGNAVSPPPLKFYAFWATDCD